MKSKVILEEMQDVTLEKTNINLKVEVVPAPLVEEDDKYIVLLFDVIKNDVKVINWDLWFQIAGVLKSNNYDKKIFIKYSKINDIQNKASETWDGI